MKEAIIEALHQLAEASVKLDLVPLDMIDGICALVDDDKVKQAIMMMWRASNERTRELEAEIKTHRECIQGMVKAHGETVETAGFKAAFFKGTPYADLKRLKLDVETDPSLARYLKLKKDSCRITRSKS